MAAIFEPRPNQDRSLVSRYPRRQVLQIWTACVAGSLVSTYLSQNTTFAQDSWKSLIPEGDQIVSEDASEDGKTKITPITALYLNPEDSFQLRFRMTVEPLEGRAPETAGGGLMIAVNDSTEGAGINRLLISRNTNNWWVAQHHGEKTAQDGKPLTRKGEVLPETILTIPTGRSTINFEGPSLSEALGNYPMSQSLIPNNPEGLLYLAAFSLPASITTIRSLDLLAKQ